MKALAKKSILFGIVFCFLIGGTGSPSRAADKFDLKVGYLPILDHLTLLVSQAQENDQFQHLTVKVKLFKEWDEMVGALKAKVIDAAFILAPLAMDLFNEGVPIKTILLAHRNGSAITIKKDLSITTPADLKGKIIAIPHRKSTHTALLNHYLLRGNLSLADVSPRVIAPPNMLQALQLGKIDGFIVAEPFGSKAQSLGIGKILVLTKDIVNYHVECIVVVNEKIIETHPAALQEWIASLIRAGRWIEEDKEKNGARLVAQTVAGKYFVHNEQTVIDGLLNPSDRIVFSDLNPVAADFKIIMDISLQANLIKEVDLESFIDQLFILNKNP